MLATVIPPARVTWRSALSFDKTYLVVVVHMTMSCANGPLDGIFERNTIAMGCNGWFGESARRIILVENTFRATGFNISEGSGLNTLGNGLPSTTDNAVLRNLDVGNPLVRARAGYNATVGLAALMRANHLRNTTIFTSRTMTLLLKIGSHLC